MDSSNSQNNKRKNIALSILTGVGYGIGGFIVGGLLTEGLALLFFSLIGFCDFIGQNCGEMALFVTVLIAFVGGLVTAIKLGISGYRRSYTRLSKTQ